MKKGKGTNQNRTAEMTIEMAQAVLALYATLESAMRPPFDQRKEVNIKLNIKMLS